MTTRPTTSSHTGADPSERAEQAPPDGAADRDEYSLLAVRIHGEYREMPGLRLTVSQAARLFGVASVVAEEVLHQLQRASVLASSDHGVFFIKR